MSDYLETISNTTKVIRGHASHLRKLGNAFYMTGNAEIADQLDYISSSIMQAEEDLQDAISKNVTDQYNQSMQSTTNMINACISVATSKETNEEPL